MYWLFFALSAGVTFGISNIINKEILEKEHSFEFLSVYYLFNLLVLIPFIKDVGKVDIRILLTVLLRSIFVVMYMSYYIKALKHMQISVVGPLTNLNPLFVLIGGVVFLGEIITGLQIIGILILLIGSYVLTSDGHFKNLTEPIKKLFKSKYTHYLLFSALFFVAISLLSKIVLRDISSLTLLFYHYIFTASIFLGITFFVFNGVKDIFEGIKIGGFWIFISASIGTLATFLIFNAFADPFSNIGIITAVRRISILIGVVFGGKLFHEKHILLKTAASFLMLIGIFLIMI